MQSVNTTAVAAALSSIVLSASAMMPIQDAELGQVAGRDGISGLPGSQAASSGNTPNAAIKVPDAQGGTAAPAALGGTAPQIAVAPTDFVSKRTASDGQQGVSILAYLNIHIGSFTYSTNNGK